MLWVSKATTPWATTPARTTPWATTPTVTRRRAARGAKVPMGIRLSIDAAREVAPLNASAWGEPCCARVRVPWAHAKGAGAGGQNEGVRWELASS